VRQYFNAIREPIKGWCLINNRVNDKILSRKNSPVCHFIKIVHL
jgi:hypothetical protein